MTLTSVADLERFGKLWDSWRDAKKPSRLWFQWWCVGQPTIPDDKKIEHYKRMLMVQ
jgi:hypothetical protein